MAVLQFLWLNSCVEEYWPEVDKYENLLVVDGGVSNQPGPYIIKISKSSPIDSAIYIPFAGCVVKILVDDGEEEVLTEFEPGVFYTSPNGIQGQIGKSYKLNISTPQGEEYESSFEILKEVVEIDSVYAEVEYRNKSDYDHPLAGYQFYVDAKQSVTDTNYFMWQMNETYHYQSDFFIHWYYTNRLYDFHPMDSLFNCWRTNRIKQIHTYNSSLLSNNKLEHFPLNYVSTQNRKLTIKYSLWVNQFTMSKQAFKFWNAIQEQNSEQGSLYSHQPYQIKGNIKNINDEEEPVLGYFLVASSHSKRIFVDRIDAPFYYSYCSFNEGWSMAYGDLGLGGPYDYPQFVVLYEGTRGVANANCVDCREKGGTTVKPYFWED